ncbi:MAG TPA: hypothetical protein PLY05_08090, partial [Agitococcus sp.]|nr:hypothetical protein [Agitococcus sp.]
GGTTWQLDSGQRNSARRKPKKSKLNALKTGEYTADKVAERKRKAKVKKSCGWGCSYGDKRFRWNRSINYCGFMKTTKKAEREKAKERVKAALKD